MNVTRMSICEAVNDDAVKEVVNQMQEHARSIPGLTGHSILVEEGGRMVILLTGWNNRQECLAYHASKAHRQLVATTQHMLIGDYVVKLFQNRTELQSVL